MNQHNKQCINLVHITYRYKEEDNSVIKEMHLYIFDDKNHDTLLVQHCLLSHSNWLKEQGLQFKRHWVWSDECVVGVQHFSGGVLCKHKQTKYDGLGDPSIHPSTHSLRLLLLINDCGQEMRCFAQCSMMMMIAVWYCITNQFDLVYVSMSDTIWLAIYYSTTKNLFTVKVTLYFTKSNIIS